jgi:toxin YoeB
MNEITFAGNAWAEYLIWQTQDKKTLRRINGLLKEMLRHPFEGRGQAGTIERETAGKVEPPYQ